MVISKIGYRKAIAINYLALLSFLLLNSILFVHSHILPNGQIVVHAHPFVPKDNGQPKPHTHTPNEYVTFAKLFYGNNILPVGLFDFIVLRIPELIIKTDLQIGFWLTHTLSDAYRRGPPHLIY